MTTVKILNQKIQNIAELKQHEIDKLNYIKYKYIFDETLHILKKLNILLYGGTALNDLLPTHLKFYDQFTLPDIDIFCVDAKKKADYIVKILNKKNFIATSISEAMHPGTYKIYTEGLQIIDITEVSPKVFKILSKNSTKNSLNIKIVNHQFLRLSLHMILSQAYDSHRWSKVYDRLIKFYTFIPPDNSLTLHNLPTFNDDYIKAIEYIYSFLYNSDYVLFGPHEIHTINSHLEKYSIQPYIFFLVNTDHFKDTIHSIVNKLNKNKDFNHFKLYFISENNNFIYDFAIIKFKDIPILNIFKAETCMTYNIYNNLRIGTIHTIIRMYLGIIISEHNYYKPFQHIFKYYIDKLTILLLKNINTNKSLLKTVVTQCYGKSESIITLRKNRILRLQNIS